jgi:hypothetical protein
MYPPLSSIQIFSLSTTTTLPYNFCLEGTCSANKLGVVLAVEGLGPLDGCAKRAVDDELGKDTERAGDAEEDGVVVLFREAVVLEEDAGVL